MTLGIDAINRQLEALRDDYAFIDGVLGEHIELLTDAKKQFSAPEDAISDWFTELRAILKERNATTLEWRISPECGFWRGEENTFSVYGRFTVI